MLEMLKIMLLIPKVSSKLKHFIGVGNVAILLCCFLNPWRKLFSVDRWMLSLRSVQTMEHILRHSLTRQPRTWYSLVWTVSKHAANMPWICSEAELYCLGTNQKLSLFRTNTKPFLAAEYWFGPAAVAVCATSIFSQTLEHHVRGCRGSCAAEHVRWSVPAFK